MIHVFTSAAINYLPKVRILFESIKKYHPEFIIHLALPDKKPDWFNAPNEGIDSIITIEDLDIPNKTSWIFKHSIVELSTAIKPFVLNYLLKREDCSAVLYFDPDIVLFSRLDDLIGELNTGSILITPHLTKPAPKENLDSIRDHEIYSSLRNGIYNLGFFGVKNDENGEAFGKWWSERLYHFCQDSPETGLFTDQKWIDFVPVYFNGVIILKNARFNVATWNLSTRNIQGFDINSITVDGKPLGFYHFTGWDNGSHLLQAQKYGGHTETVSILLNWYEQKIKKDSIAEKNTWGYGTFSNGKPIVNNQRLIYRSRSDLQAVFPNPFEATHSHCYYNWFNTRAIIEHRSLFK
ncbi:glycosyl transferase [Niallia nealsonii]|uniref:Glycosyl transferase n=1 Tax=Niallia nealsonii TaxID=115979 RepID=A0A2N0YZS3_9BACI|nr:glycosyl transferase [Niallia nealsonii]PKG22763.1 glycosyl transferase [Niallia nealsonii]